MCKSKQLKKKGKKTQCTNYEGPSFNRDRCHATPAFILPSEKVTPPLIQTEYLMTTREFLRDHEKKVKEYEEELHELVHVSLPSTCQSRGRRASTATCAGSRILSILRYQCVYTAYQFTAAPRQYPLLPLQ